jgi:lipopolysaccharide/colanic/teichoic acid biosynthesis glycosyltransferase
LAPDRIGVILPSTPVEGATRVAEEVTSSFSPKPRWEVFCYPTEAPPSQSPWGGLPLAEPQIPLQDSGPMVQPAESFFLLCVPLWKRCLDVAGAGTGLVLLSPVLAVAALAVKLTSPGPVLFRQKRSGQGGRPFVIYKLRTMVQGAEKQRNQIAELNERDGPAFKIKADPRVTAVGRVLRATGIDEIPQLWNVLIGDMSLVGPRPLPCEESDACQGWRRRRLEVKPGITCIWQISQRSRVSFDDWVRMDLQYARSRSFLNDVKLMLQTVPAALSGRPAK